jgi:hypothetical protein
MIKDVEEYLKELYEEKNLIEQRCDSLVVEKHIVHFEHATHIKTPQPCKESQW